MTFAHPDRLFALVGILLLIGVAFAVKTRVRQRLGKLFGDHAASYTAIVFRHDQFSLRAGVLIAGTTLLILALAKPQWGFHWQDVRGRGASIFIAIDLSRSMYAEDQKPNRLERAKRKVIDFLHMQKSDRVGLISFAGDAFIQIPLTQDYGAVEMFLENMSPEQMPRQGTSFSKAINLAVETFKHLNGEESLSDALVIMSDGEDHDPGLDEALRDAKAAKVKIYTLGFGTEEGSPIPDNGGGFKQDQAGHMVHSKLEAGLLTKIAEETGGVFQKASLGDEDWQRIYQGGIKEAVSEAEFDSGRRRVAEDRSFWFVLAGTILMALQFFLGHSPKILAVLLCGGWVFAAPDALFAKPKTDPVEAFTKGDYAAAKEGFTEQESKSDDLRHTYNRAVSSYKLGDYKDAAEGFAKAAQSKDPALAASALFNLGNAEAMVENFDGAVAAYEDALKLAPNNQKASDNLAAVKAQREQKKQEQKQDGDQKDKPSEPEKDGKESHKPGDKNEPKGDEQETGEPGKDDKQKGRQQRDGEKKPTLEEKDGEKTAGQGKEDQRTESPAKQGNDATKNSEELIESVRKSEEQRKEADRVLKGAKDHAQEVFRSQRRRQNDQNQGRDDAKDW